MKRILENLFALDLIKVHWVLSKEVRYRPQKDTSARARRQNQVQRFPAKRDNAYITLNRSGFEKLFKEEQ